MRRRRGGSDVATRPVHPPTSPLIVAPPYFFSQLLHRVSVGGSVKGGAVCAAALGAATASAGLGGGLVYDDRALVVENQDLRPSNPWRALLYHDFWGTSLDDPRSHTSWRPVTVATLKMNYHIHQLDPSGYHAINLVLHAFVCAMVVLVAKRCGIGGHQWQPSALCGMLFAVHPVHGARYAFGLADPNVFVTFYLTFNLRCVIFMVFEYVSVEAVANVAGRAELLSTGLSLLAFLCFTTACPHVEHGTCTKKRAVAVGAACCLFLLSTLAKETGFTVLGALWAYDLLHNGDLLGRLRTTCGCCCGSGKGNIVERDEHLHEKATADYAGKTSVIYGKNRVHRAVKNSSTEDISGRISPACRDGTAFWRALLTRHIPLLGCAMIYLAFRRSLSHRFSPAISSRDNHLALEREWLTRVLSYASLHGRYMALLLYPTVRANTLGHVVMLTVPFISALVHNVFLCGLQLIHRGFGNDCDATAVSASVALRRLLLRCDSSGYCICRRPRLAHRCYADIYWAALLCCGCNSESRHRLGTQLRVAGRAFPAGF